MVDIIELASRLESEYAGIDLLDKASNPQFDKAQKVHDWRNYVPDFIKSHWSYFSIESKVLMVAAFQTQADKEEWE